MILESSLTIGILLGSYHYDNGNPNFIDPQGRRVHNGATPGAYLQTPSIHRTEIFGTPTEISLTAGVYKNSWRRTSYFVGSTFTTSFPGSPHSPLSASISIGGVSGYANSKILFAPSIAYSFSSRTSLRTFLLPGNMPTISFALEQEF